MDKAIEVDIHGIKCDTKGCGWNDMTVSVNDYEQWLNKPCPECGSNLLTQADFDMVQQMLGFATLVNDVLPPEVLEAHGIDMTSEDVVRVAFEADGSGKLDPHIIKEH